MCDSLSAHNGCVEMFRDSASNRRVWGPSTLKNTQVNIEHNIKYRKASSPYCRSSNALKPCLHIEAGNDDFKHLVNYLPHFRAPTKKIMLILHEPTSFLCDTEKLIPDHSTKKADWVMVKNMIENEWDFVHVMDHVRPSYAEIVMKDRFCAQE